MASDLNHCDIIDPKVLNLLKRPLRHWRSPIFVPV